MQQLKAILGATMSLSLLACSADIKAAETAENSEECAVEMVVLGVGQDAGAPQLGNPDDPAWSDPSKRLYATSLALIDHENQKRYLFEATPDIREQMQMLDRIATPNLDGPYLDGIFLTHAHIGHYAGLMFLGRESMGARGVPVYVMPRMKEFLETSGPWSQLVELGNIELHSISDIKKFQNDVEIIASNVPHRDEYSETVSFIIARPEMTVFFVPDIDSWSELAKSFEQEYGIKISTRELLQSYLDVTNYAFLDATFYDDNELPGRDMSEIPHPRVTETMDLIDAAGDESLKEKIRFIHINHTNPLRDTSSDAYREMTRRGYKLAYRGERFCL
ncbi:MAG: MBL fold metallo-hydrolase [Hellea sp.]|nr:MBL fold metallo-hydrolase [Hellea sp.]